MAVLNLSVNQSQALKIASEYLKQKRNVDVSSYHSAVILDTNPQADRYLQRTLGFDREKTFLKQNHFELFFWQVRFYKENQKEEYRLSLSPETGDVLSYLHAIDDTDKRPQVSAEDARTTIISFLKNNIGLDLANNYTEHNNSSQKLDNRTDYTYAWRKNDVFIPWEGTEKGGAKLLTEVTVSGQEILGFQKMKLEIPESFTRFVEKQSHLSANLSGFFEIFYTLLMGIAVFSMLKYRNDAIVSRVKRFYIGLIITIFICHLIFNALQYQLFLFLYPTTTSFISYFWRHGLNILMQIFFLTMAVILPGLAGEGLHYQLWPEHKAGSFFTYVQSTFFSKQIARLIFMGYLVALTTIGFQTLIFHLGYKFLGVWQERQWLSQLSSASLPFMAAMVIGFQASVVEEITFRLFSIGLGKKLFKSLILAVIVSALFWGLGHSHYWVFPVWFRVIEVTLIGLFLSWIYLRYGIICVVVAHYLFDVSWGTAVHLINQTQPLYFWGTIGVLILPLTWAMAAQLMNRSVEEQTAHWKLTPNQLFNLSILKTYLAALNGANRANLRQQLIEAGWDVAVVETALEGVEDLSS